MQFFYIYKITNNINKKYYIGKRTSKIQPIDDPYFGSGKLLKMAIRKYGKDNFIKEIIELCINEDSLNEREIHWIYKLNSFSPNGYNINVGGKGGDTFTNNPNKEKVRAIIAGINIGRKHTNEYKEKLSKLRKGKTQAPCEKEKCIYCYKITDIRNLKRWHNENCLKNIKNIDKKRNLKKGDCPHCNKSYTMTNLVQHHLDKCKLKPK